jgi:hypothetical protein
MKLDAICKGSQIMLCREIIAGVKIKRNLRVLCMGRMQSRPLARGLHVCATHPLQIRIHPTGIRKISTDMLISPLTNVRHCIHVLKCHGWKLVVFKNVRMC